MKRALVETNLCNIIFVDPNTSHITPPFTTVVSDLLAANSIYAVCGRQVHRG